MHILSNILLLAIHFFTFIFCDSKLQQIQLHRIEEDVVQMHQGQFRGEWSREVDSYKLQATSCKVQGDQNLSLYLSFTGQTLCTIEV